MNEKIVAWHFLRDDGTTSYGGLKPKVGEKLVHEGELVLCDSGFHASIRAIDASKYAPGALVCRVELSGNIIRGNDKIVASERTIVWQADATNTLHEFACLCAEDVLNMIPEKERGVFVATIAAKRAWIRGDISGEELTAARTAAMDAARTAARSAARPAPMDAARSAAGDAAGAAAMDAAWAAAWDAARPAPMDAAWAAAWAAAWDAAWAAAWDAARSAQNERLERMLNELV